MSARTFFFFLNSRLKCTASYTPASILLSQTPRIYIVVSLKSVKPLGLSLSEWHFTYTVTLLPVSLFFFFSLEVPGFVFLLN